MGSNTLPLNISFSTPFNFCITSILLLYGNNLLYPGLYGLILNEKLSIVFIPKLTLPANNLGAPYVIVDELINVISSSFIKFTSYKLKHLSSKFKPYFTITF
nr:MAG TPA: hypothetical protein [Caudoviricetes sp.]